MVSVLSDDIAIRLPEIGVAISRCVPPRASAPALPRPSPPIGVATGRASACLEPAPDDVPAADLPFALAVPANDVMSVDCIDGIDFACCNALPEALGDGGARESRPPEAPVTRGESRRAVSPPTRLGRRRGAPRPRPGRADSGRAPAVRLLSAGPPITLRPSSSAPLLARWAALRPARCLGDVALPRFGGLCALLLRRALAPPLAVEVALLRCSRLALPLCAPPLDPRESDVRTVWPLCLRMSAPICAGIDKSSLLSTLPASDITTPGADEVGLFAALPLPLRSSPSLPDATLPAALLGQNEP